MRRVRAGFFRVFEYWIGLTAGLCERTAVGRIHHPPRRTVLTRPSSRRREIEAGSSGFRSTPAQRKEGPWPVVDEGRAAARSVGRSAACEAASDTAKNKENEKFRASNVLFFAEVPRLGAPGRLEGNGSRSVWVGPSLRSAKARKEPAGFRRASESRRGDGHRRRAS